MTDKSLNSQNDADVLARMGITKYEGEWPQHGTFSWEDKNAERDELVKKLNDETNEFIANLKPKKYEDGWKESEWRKEMEQHPLFMSKPPEEGQELPPLVEAMQQLKYDAEVNSTSDIAMSYKDDGNVNFKRKKYRWAVDCYTKGIQAKCDDIELNVQLYSNRAAAHYHMGNYGSSLKDATSAKNLDASHLKALQRGSKCCFQLRRYDDCIDWCNAVLKVSPGEKEFLDLIQKCEQEKKKVKETDKEVIENEKRKKKETQQLIKTILSRGIKFGDHCLEPDAIDGSIRSNVHFNDEKELVWPAIFFYPEYEQTDYVQNFHEDSTFGDHLDVMFSKDSPPGWDVEKKYISDRLVVYFPSDGNLVFVKKSSPLRSVLSHPRFRLNLGTPGFIVTVAGSAFDINYRKNKSVYFD